MRDITTKIETLRTATGCGKVLCSPSTIQLIKENRLPKGNLFDIAKAAALLAAKNTAHLIPHCHPVGIDGLEINFESAVENGNGIISIHAVAKSIGRTGIEMEVLTAVSVAALTIYDLLKPVDKQLQITDIRLLEKTGGKSDRKYFNLPPSCAILVCSDSTAAGKREDKSGKIIAGLLEDAGAKITDYKIISDDKKKIQQQIDKWVKKDVPFIFTTGGTGLGPRDQTVEAVKEILERDADGVTEAMRHFGQQRTPLAMMSRAVAGSIAHTTIITLPGSSAGAKESLQAILPAIFHARKILKGGGH